MTTVRKLFVGPRVRRLRERRGWTQGALAGRLRLSLSYVSQIENNQRPVTAAVLLRLADVFGGDVAQFSDEGDRHRLAELDAALADRTLRIDPVPPVALARMVEQAPELADAFLTLYQRYLRLQEEHAQTLDRLYGEFEGGHGGGRLVPLPHEVVREYLNQRDNYLDGLDRLAEQLARRWALRPGGRAAAVARALETDCGVEVTVGEPGFEWLRRHEPSRRRLVVAPQLSDAQRAFQLATQYALLAHRDILEAEIREGGFTDAATQALARQALAHYFAGALLLPYGEFLAQARRARYDIEGLQGRFRVGFETICHRLSTLQRPGERSVPFYFVRLDQAGNISKRQSATNFHFARHGGACPLWHVHEAFAHPGRILTQVVEMPDGTRFFGIARTVERGGGGWRRPKKLFAIGLGCELSQARELVYADGIDLDDPPEVMPIGPGCRVCPRPDCVQRAFPPAGKPLVPDSDSESLVPFRFVTS